MPAFLRRIAGLCIATACAATFAAHPLAASAKKEEPGPCRQGQVGSVVNRPSTGSAPTVTGSPCTAETGKIEFEYGYRNEVDVGPRGSSNLASYPMSLIRIGVDKHDEVILLPPNEVLRGGNAGPGYEPAIGAQDMGIGWKHNIKAHDFFQDALEIFMTVPSGTNGNSYVQPTFQLNYVASFSLGTHVSVTPSVGIVDALGTPFAGGAPRRFLTYQPSLTVSYALGDNTAFFVNDNVGVPLTPTGGTSNTLLVAVSHALSPGTVLDLEADYNLTPTAGYRERAVGFGGAFYL